MNRLLLTSCAAAFIFAAAPAYAQIVDGPLAQQKDLPNAKVVTAEQDETNSDVAIMPDQGAARGLIVTDRTPPEYQAQGAPVGSFRFLPEVTVDETYNDNIYATKNNAQDDFITTFIPRIALRSDWNRHALNFTAASADGVYSDHTSENFNDYLLQTDGKLDVTRNTRLAGLFSYSGNHEERGAPNDIATQTDPVAFTVRTAQAEFFHQFNRAKVDVVYSNQYFDYEDGHETGGAEVNNGLRNRTDNEVTGRLAYMLTPSYDIYIQSSYNNRSYDTANADYIIPGAGAGHIMSNSDGYNVYGGLHADLTGKLFGDIYAGYMSQSYDNIAYKDFSGIGYGANGYWNATTLDTFTVNVGRDVEETIIPGAASYVESRVRANWDHELLRNVILSGVIGYDYDDYQGIDRTDNVLVAGGGIKYLINHNLSFFGNYDYIRRDVSGTIGGVDQNVNNYDQNRFLVGLKAAL